MIRQDASDYIKEILGRRELMVGRICPHCGAHLDPEERCDCQDQEEKEKSPAPASDQDSNK